MSRAQGWDARIQLTVDADTKHDLEVARLADHVPATARIRAMIAIWQTDPDFCERVDDLAREMTGRTG